MVVGGGARHVEDAQTATFADCIGRRIETRLVVAYAAISSRASV